MFTREPVTAHDAIRRLEARYEQYLVSGQYRPFLYPWATLGAAVVILYLLIDHRSGRILDRGRYVAFAFISIFAIHSITTLRARNPAAAFGVGLISAWSILWCGVMLVFNDAQRDFQRIERQETRLDGDCKSTGQSTSTANGHASDLQHRKTKTDAMSNDSLGTTESPAQRTGTFAWQPYPTSPFIERLDWVVDIFCNFRGMGWNWQISGLAAPPSWVQDELLRNNNTPRSKTSTHVGATKSHRHHTTASLLRANIYIFFRNYLLLDALKTLTAHDPYFWGVDHAPPPAYLTAALQASPTIIRSSRLLICLAAIGLALQFIFSLGPLFFVGMLGPRVLGARGEPWMYPASFGAFDMVLDRGLGGWWGGWWHQTFRFAFEQPGRRAVERLGWAAREPRAKLLRLAVAFVLSGVLHACGSYTQIGETRPLRGPFCFFVLQIVGVAGQMAAAGVLRRAGVVQRLPRWGRRAANFVVVHVWFYYTAPLLCDDFARGGVWLFEPVPLSPLRGLGLGSKEDGWWCWGGKVVGWHRGEHWWDTGLAL